MPELTVRCRAQPGEDFTLTLPATRTLGPRARLLEGVLHLVSRRARMPARDLRTQLRALLATGDLRDQRARHLPDRQLCTRRRHHPYRGRRRKLGPPLLKRFRGSPSRAPGVRPPSGPDTRPIKPTASHGTRSKLVAPAAHRPRDLDQATATGTAWRGTGRGHSRTCTPPPQLWRQASVGGPPRTRTSPRSGYTPRTLINQGLPATRVQQAMPSATEADSQAPRYLYA